MRIKIMLWLMLLTSTLILSQQSIIILKPTSDEIAKYELLGGVVSGKLTNNLKAELMRAIKEEGVINAIGVCNLKAIPLTLELVESNKTIVNIKRVTEKFRNPKNAPDELELEALKYFEQKWENPPKNLLQKIALHDSTFINYYQPLKIGGLCTACHGKEENIEAELKSKLKQLYPNDKATGYEVGDFRGVIKITFLNK
ncbi:MAG: DUF3365 domain-containing protein [Bacteroidetes bacterium]|nr:DUF3365 domain-containing protein [Bacteroidota bacterium]